MSQSATNTRLIDLGERSLVDVLKKYCDPEIGSDCALVEFGPGTLVLTTDPVPEPAAQVIAGDSDPYWKGWLLTIINASDLAAAAAEPVAFLAAIDAPSDYPLDQFERLLAGISEACASEGLRYVGGNLRESQKLTAVGTAVGRTDKNIALSRKGVRAGDLLVVVGAGGQFWLDALYTLEGGRVSNVNSSPLFRPKSQSRAMRELARRNLVRASMDNSDGLIPTLQQLCKTNSVGVTLDLDALPPPSGYEAHKAAIGMSCPRLWLGWGDWNVVVAVPVEAERTLQQVARDDGIAITIAGRFNAQFPHVAVTSKGETQAAPRIESERFSVDSWFSAGISRYIEILRNASLPGGL